MQSFSKIILPVLALLGHVSTQGFASSCVNYDLLDQSRTIFYANCYTEAGSLHYTEIDLSLCLSNSNGNLIVRGLLIPS